MTRTTTKQTLTYSDFYELTSKELNIATFKKVLEHYNSLLVEELLEGKQLVLPFSLGTLSIRKFKPNKPFLFDFGHYRKTGEKIAHKNWHSAGYSAGYYWDNRPKVVPSLSCIERTLFRFKASRANSRKLKDAIVEQNAIYKFLDRRDYEVHFYKSRGV